MDFRMIEAAGFRWRVQVHGAGEPVMLLHGFPENHESWRYNIASLVAAGRTVYVPDLKGYGGTDKPPPGSRLGDYRVSQLAAEVAELIGALGHQSMDVVGHDWGGILVSAMTVTHPGRLRRIALINAPFRRFIPWTPRHIYFFNLPSLPERRFWRAPTTFVGEIIGRWSSVPDAFDEESIIAYTRAFQQGGSFACALAYYRSLRRDLPFIGRALVSPPPRLPALIVFGDADPIMPPAVARMAHADLPGSRLELLQGVGHFPHREAPEEFNRILLEFFSESPDIR